MRKGIFFTLLFSAFMLLLLSLVIFYTQSLNQRGIQQNENAKIQKFAFIADDAASDLLSFMQINALSFSRNSTHAFITINETIPSSLASAQTELSSYQGYFQGSYAQKQNLKGALLLDLSRFSNAPFIYFGIADFNYSYSDLSKSSATFRGSSAVAGFSLTIGSASSDKFMECGWNNLIAGNLEVKISIAGSNCAPQRVSVDPLSESKFWANTSAGKYLNLSFGLVGGNSYSLKISPKDVKMSSVLNATFSSTQPLNAWLPAGVQFTEEYEIHNLILRKA